MLRISLTVFTALVLAAASSVHADDKDSKWVSLFDGKTLNGWKPAEVLVRQTVLRFISFLFYFRFVLLLIPRNPRMRFLRA